MTPGERARKAREVVFDALTNSNLPLESEVSSLAIVEFTDSTERGPGAWVTVRIWTPT